MKNFLISFFIVLSLAFNLYGWQCRDGGDISINEISKEVKVVDVNNKLLHSKTYGKNNKADQTIFTIKNNTSSPQEITIDFSKAKKAGEANYFRYLLAGGLDGGGASVFRDDRDGILSTGVYMAHDVTSRKNNKICYNDFQESEKFYSTNHIKIFKLMPNSSIDIVVQNIRNGGLLGLQGLTYRIDWGKALIKYRAIDASLKGQRGKICLAPMTIIGMKQDLQFQATSGSVSLKNMVFLDGNDKPIRVKFDVYGFKLKNPRDCQEGVCVGTPEIDLTKKLQSFEGTVNNGGKFIPNGKVNNSLRNSPYYVYRGTRKELKSGIIYFRNFEVLNDPKMNYINMHFYMNWADNAYYNYTCNDFYFSARPAGFLLNRKLERTGKCELGGKHCAELNKHLRQDYKYRFETSPGGKNQNGLYSDFSQNFVAIDANGKILDNFSRKFENVHLQVGSKDDNNISRGKMVFDKGFGYFYNHKEDGDKFIYSKSKGSSKISLIDDSFDKTAKDAIKELESYCTPDMHCSLKADMCEYGKTDNYMDDNAIYNGPAMGFTSISRIGCLPGIYNYEDLPKTFNPNFPNTIKWSKMKSADSPFYTFDPKQNDEEYINWQESKKGLPLKIIGQVHTGKVGSWGYWRYMQKGIKYEQGVNESKAPMSTRFEILYCRPNEDADRCYNRKRYKNEVAVFDSDLENLPNSSLMYENKAKAMEHMKQGLFLYEDYKVEVDNGKIVNLAEIMYPGYMSNNKIPSAYPSEFYYSNSPKHNNEVIITLRHRVYKNNNKDLGYDYNHMRETGIDNEEGIKYVLDNIQYFPGADSIKPSGIIRMFRARPFGIISYANYLKIHSKENILKAEELPNLYSSQRYSAADIDKLFKGIVPIDYIPIDATGNWVKRYWVPAMMDSSYSSKKVQADMYGMTRNIKSDDETINLEGIDKEKLVVQTSFDKNHNKFMRFYQKDSKGKFIKFDGIGGTIIKYRDEMTFKPVEIKNSIVYKNPDILYNDCYEFRDKNNYGKWLNRNYQGDFNSCYIDLITLDKNEKGFIKDKYGNLIKKYDSAKYFNFIPYTVKTDISITNNNGDFSYLGDKENSYANIKLKISVLDKEGKAIEAYSGGKRDVLYGFDGKDNKKQKELEGLAQDYNGSFTLKVDKWPIVESKNETNSKINGIYEIKKNNSGDEIACDKYGKNPKGIEDKRCKSDKFISKNEYKVDFTINKNAFWKGEAKLDYRLNFNRDDDSPSNPLFIDLNDKNQDILELSKLTPNDNELNKNPEYYGDNIIIPMNKDNTMPVKPVIPAGGNAAYVDENSIKNSPDIIPDTNGDVYFLYGAIYSKQGYETTVKSNVKSKHIVIPNFYMFYDNRPDKDKSQKEKQLQKKLFGLEIGSSAFEDLLNKNNSVWKTNEGDDWENLKGFHLNKSIVSGNDKNLKGKYEKEKVSIKKKDDWDEVNSSQEAKIGSIKDAWKPSPFDNIIKDSNVKKLDNNEAGIELVEFDFYPNKNTKGGELKYEFENSPTKIGGNDMVDYLKYKDFNDFDAIIKVVPSELAKTIKLNWRGSGSQGQVLDDDKNTSKEWKNTTKKDLNW